MAILVDRIGLQWEALYPAIMGAGAGAIAYVFVPDWLHFMHERQWAIENIFVAIFTLGTVAAGFGLAIYTFLLTTESGFIGRTKNSIYYKHLLKFVLLATIANAILSATSIPGMVIKDVPSHHSILNLYVGIWGGISVWSAATMFRAIYIFSIFAREHH
jgi:hypothetical protein